MRRTRLLGWGLAGVFTAAPGAANAQFAVDRTAPTPSPVFQPHPQPAVTPAAASQPAPSQYQPSPAAYQPSPYQPVAATVTEPAEAAPHPMAVRPEHGGWFVCVKSFAGPQARQMAEELANEVRETHKAAAFLAEWGGDERRKELLKQEKIRQYHQKEQAPFLALREQMRIKAQQEGTEFDETPPTVRIPKVEYQEQWAVLVGYGYKDMEAARKALDVVRKWPLPQGKPHLLDQAAVASPGKEGGEAAYINPYATAMVVPNPAVRRAAGDQPSAVDPGLKRWNDKEELSLLKCKKGYTLFVKSFTIPVKTQSKDSDPGVFGQFFGSSRGAEMLQATAQQARALADALRSKEMAESLGKKNLPAVPFESYVLHVKTGSIVTVGGFESEDDPELLRVQQVLQSITFQVADKHGRPTEVQKMFESVYPIPVPKVQ